MSRFLNSLCDTFDVFEDMFSRALTCKIPITKSQIPNNVQIPISNDQTEFVSNLGDWDLFEIWCLGFGASYFFYHRRLSIKGEPKILFVLKFRMINKIAKAMA